MFRFAYPSPTSIPTSYDSYDARRSALEHRALAEKQLARRQAEAALLRRQQAALERQQQEQELYEALVVRELERRQVEAYRAREAQQEREREEANAWLRAREAHILRLRKQEQLRRAAVEQPPWFFFTQDPTEVDDAVPEVTSAPVTVPTSSPVAAPTPVDTPTSIDHSTASSTPATEDPAAESAAATLQRHFRTHLARRQALSTLASLSSTLASQRTSFTFPSSLVFAPSPPSSLADSPAPEEVATEPKLAYSSVNAPVLAYEDFLVGLLSKVDEVQSGGDKVVKSARKELVRAVEAELRKLDEEKERAWREQSVVEEKEVEEQQMAVDGADAVVPLPSLDAVAAPTVIDNTPSPSSPLDLATETSLTPSHLAPTPTPPATPAPLSTPTPHPTQSRPNPFTTRTHHRRRSSSSDSASSSDAESSSDVEMDAAIEDILRAAEKLGEQVVRLEAVDEGEVDEFVVV